MTVLPLFLLSAHVNIFKNNLISSIQTLVIYHFTTHCTVYNDVCDKRIFDLIHETVLHIKSLLCS